MRLKGLLAGSLLFLIACNRSTAPEQLDSVLSWLGTAGMAADAWLHHTTPDRYTRETLQLSQQSVQRLAADLTKSPAPGIDHPVLDTVLSRSRARIAEMARLVEAKDSAAFASQLDSLREEEGIVKRLADAAGSRQ